MIDFSNFTNALNKVIMPSIESQIYNRAPLWQLLGGWNGETSVANRANVKVDRFENNQVFIPIRTSAHSGIVSIGSQELYQYGNPTLNITRADIKTIVGSFTITKQLLNTNNAGSIVKPLMYYSESLANDMAMDLNRQGYGDGSGTVATTAGTGTSTTDLLITPSTNGDIDYSRYLPVGTFIKIGSNAVVQVVAVVGDNELTISAAQSWSGGATISKVTGSNTVATEISGLKGMIAASGLYQNLDSASENTWKAYVDNTSESLTTSNIQNKMHAQYFKANKTGHVDWIIMNSKAMQMYGNSLSALQRFDGGKEVLSGGWRGLQYMGGNATILLDYDCPDDRIYFLSTEDLVFAEYQPFTFEQGTDGRLLKIAQQLNYEVTASWMGNVGTVARNAHALMMNKTF